MSEIKERDLSILTDQQRKAYLLRQEGLTFQKVADAMGLKSLERARQLVNNAERRFREYDAYHAYKARNNEPVDFPLTRGELKIISEALTHMEIREMGKRHASQTSWRDHAAYEFQILEALRDRLESVIYPNRNERASDKLKRVVSQTHTENEKGNDENESN